MLERPADRADRKSTRLNSSHQIISYAVFCLKKKKKKGYFLLQKKINKTERIKKKKKINQYTQLTLSLCGTYAIYISMSYIFQPVVHLIVFEPPHDTNPPRRQLIGAK